MQFGGKWKLQWWAVWFFSINYYCGIFKERLAWIGHLVWMYKFIIYIYLCVCLCVCECVSKLQQNRRVGRPEIRWEDNIIEDIRILKVKNWRSQTQDTRRDVWRKLLKKAITQIGLSFQEWWCTGELIMTTIYVHCWSYFSL